MRSSDFLARIGGDEFAVLISGTITEDGLIIFQKHITEAISTPFSSGAMKGECITASMGCATYPDNGTTIEALMNHADHSKRWSDSVGQHFAEDKCKSLIGYVRPLPSARYL